VERDGTLTESVEVRLGRRLRELRRQRRLSLTEVATQTGISPSFISHIENGKSDMTIGRLLRLADFYEVEPGDLLEQPDHRQATVIRNGEHTRIHSEAESLDSYLLVPDMAHSLLPILTRYDEGGGTDDAFSYEGELFLYVLEGSVAISFQGAETIVLQAGDSALVDPSRSHSFANAGAGQARLLSCSSTPEGTRPPSLTTVRRRRARGQAESQRSRSE
jgi:transcriptional regulator with XRE-family HTH domain